MSPAFQLHCWMVTDCLPTFRIVAVRTGDRKPCPAAEARDRIGNLCLASSEKVSSLPPDPIAPARSSSWTRWPERQKVNACQPREARERSTPPMATASGIQSVPELVCTITTLTMTRVTGPGVGAGDLIMPNERSGARPKLGPGDHRFTLSSMISIRPGRMFPELACSALYTMILAGLLGRLGVGETTVTPTQPPIAVPHCAPRSQCRETTSGKLRRPTRLT